MDERIVQVLWEGPFTLDEIEKLNKPSDKGLYQVYTYHPVYGDALVYIGMTEKGEFASRILWHEYDLGSDSDKKRTTYYVGRLIYKLRPPQEQWKDEMKQAEKLLIHAHAPAYNSSQIQAVSNPGEAADVRVLNWGDCRSLHREVSGRMWTAKLENSRKPYGSDIK
jgi:hypothetical protein